MKNNNNNNTYSQRNHGGRQPIPRPTSAGRRRSSPPSQRHQQQPSIPPLSIVTRSGTSPRAAERPLSSSQTRAAAASMSSRRRQPPPPSVPSNTQPPPHTSLPHTSPSSSSLSSSFLVKLSDACSQHVTSLHPTPTSCALTLEEAPAACRDALSSVRKIVALVEQQQAHANGATTTHQRPSSSGSSSGGGGARTNQRRSSGNTAAAADAVAVSNVSHMCDFYNQVLSGGICPHAPHLFLSVADVLPRVQYLFQHLASTAILHQIVQDCEQQQQDTSFHETSDSTTAEPPQRTVLAYMCDTIARLLEALPSSTLLSCVFRDLIYLNRDLAVLAASRLLDDNANTSGVTVALLEETIDANPDGSKIHECLIRLSSVENLLVWQTAAWRILHRFVSIRQERRLGLSSRTDLHGVALVREELDKSYFTTGDPDLYLWGDLQSDDDSVRALMVALRQTLTMTTTTTTTSGGDGTMRSQLSRLQRQEAVQVLLLLQKDWHQTGVDHMATLQEVALLVTQATCGPIKAQRNAAESHLPWPRTLTDGLVVLMERLVLWPPRVHGSWTTSAVAASVHRCVFAVVCQTVACISTQARPSAKVQSKATHTERPLDNVVLKACHVVVQSWWNERMKDHGTLGVKDLLAFRMQLSNTAMRQLVLLLQDRELSDSTIWIMSYVLCPPRSEKSMVAELDTLLSSCVENDVSVVAALPMNIHGEQSGEAMDTSTTTTALKRKLPLETIQVDVVTDESPEQLLIPSHPKRPKTSETDRTSFFEDEIRRFFCEAVQCSNRLRARGDGDNMDEDETGCRDDVVLFDSVTVCNALQLCLAMAKHHGGSESNLLISLSPKLQTLVHSFCEALLQVSVKLGSLDNSDANSTRLLNILACSGIFVGFAMNTYKVIAPESALFATAKSFALAARCTTERKENQFPSIPQGFHDTIHGCSMQIQGKGISPVTVVCGDFEFSVSFDETNAGSIRSSCLELSTPLSIDTDLQLRRLQSTVIRAGSSSFLRDTAGAESTEELISKCMHMVLTPQPDPFVRLLLWKALSSLLRTASPVDVRNMLSTGHSTNCGVGKSMGIENRAMQYILDTAFSDPDQEVRDFASCALGTALSGQNWTVVSALVATDEEWLQQKVIPGHPSPSFSDDCIIGRLFEYIDNLLLKLCVVPQSHLTFTVGMETLNPASQKLDTSKSVISFRRSAVKSLCSLCKNTDLSSPLERNVFQQAIIRVVRMWSNIDAKQRFEGPGTCFAELSSLSYSAGTLLHETSHTPFSASIFRDIIVPSASMEERARRDRIDNMNTSLTERQFELLSEYLRLIGLGPSAELSAVQSGDESHIERCLSSCLPHVLAQLVVEKDYVALQLTAGYKLFVLARKRQDRKSRRRTESSHDANSSDPGVVGTDVSAQAKAALRKQWSRELEKNTRELCLAPTVTDYLVSQLFIRGGRSELLFFTKTVLESTLTLKTLIQVRQLLLLKTFVAELGRSPDTTATIIRAMKVAAIVWSSDIESDKNVVDYWTKSLESDDSSLSAWISTNFMFLLVNVVQIKWTSKSDSDRLHALRSLVVILDFLQASEATKYLPQIMATVNASLSHELGGFPNSSMTLQLRSLAVRVLSKFTKLVSEAQWELLGQNLTEIVVSLVPLLSDVDGNSNTVVQTADSHKQAVSILEWLTAGDLGAKMAPYFSEIPFLPPSTSLDSVRESLRSHGVSFDNLQVESTQGTQQERSSASDGASNGYDSRVTASTVARQAALRRRLDTICSLLGNENAMVRCVVLQHLTVLLKANRELYHALVDNEGATSLRHYATVTYKGKKIFSRGTVAELLQALLFRCVHEHNDEARILLARCLGEVGAIGIHQLEELNSSRVENTSSRKTLDPPWHSAPHSYELQLITKHLVVALKSAGTTSDQHKIGFAVQQLLVSLDEAGESGLLRKPPHANPGNEHMLRKHIGKSSKKSMSGVLEQILLESDVLDVVEPFWFSEFCEAESSPPRQPPFFRTSTTFFGWLSTWTRYMAHKAHESDKKNQWACLFFACRTALRTQAGLGVAEFLLPILLLDRLCFGNGNDQKVLFTEIKDVLTDTNATGRNPSMVHSDRRKAVSVIFSAIELLQHWVEPETEQKYAKKSNGSGLAKIKSAIGGASHWQQCDCAMRIEDMMSQISLDLRAKAAASVGMHASALRFLEMSSRAAIAESVFGKNEIHYLHRKQNRSRAAGQCQETSLGKDVLASLDDYETMTALGDDNVWANPATRARDSIRQKEALRDWQGALHDYERAQQLNPNDTALKLGVLSCSLELGHFESVLQQIGGLQDGSEQSTDKITLLPLAVEASYRLGKWEALSDLVGSDVRQTLEPHGQYQVYLGEAMLDVHKKDLPAVLNKLKDARHATMEGLSSFARESYSRAYDHIVRLQALREIEDVSEIICLNMKTALGDLSDDAGLAWKRRLDTVSSSGASSIINIRLALARLADDSALEGSLFLRMGKTARKSGLYGIAANCFAQAETSFGCIAHEQQALLKSALQIQFAKLKHDSGESSLALTMLGQEGIEAMGALSDNELIAKSCRRVVDNLGIEKHGMKEKEIMDVFVRSALQSTRWMIEGGLKGGAEIMTRFRIIHRVAPKFEKGHFQFAKYVDSLLQSRIVCLQGRTSGTAGFHSGVTDDVLRSHAIARDRTCQKYILLAVEHYGMALSLDVKHVYQALPRLLSLWFDFTAISYDNLKGVPRQSGYEDEKKVSASLKKTQEEINAFMAKTFRVIPAHVFYTAMPQLISRITHTDIDTAKVAQAILRRILTKYPAQAMWSLAWVRQSNDSDRQRIGVDIFGQAIKSLSSGSNMKLHKLLVASKTLIDYLYALAKKEVTDPGCETIKIRPLSAEVDLSEFVPPVQAALSVSLASGDSGMLRDIFPRHIPRLRAFDNIVGVMVSKAKPKRLRAFIVSADTVSRARHNSKDLKQIRKEDDIGEIHFLVKQEAKGDLRKDARVQDLNKIVNRIMSSTNNAACLSGQRRRLHLRTFSVTCLSEDTGLLEWVPHTASLRSMIHKTYNPQAKAIDGKRRGRRITNFTDPQLRLRYEKKCQDTYFISGNLTKAGALFETECLKSYPPVFYWWFVQQFPNPHSWYEARTRFALSTAAWSAVGHIIGLGDRHAENILLDKTTGECVHVDFDCIFDKGLHLPKPEVVPFRLTQNMVDAFGPTGTDGVYSSNLKVAIGALRQNRDTLLSVLEPFVNDPVINWKKYRSQQRGTSRASEKDPTVEAKQKMSVIDERLRGIYNLRNPNHKTVKRTDGFENPENDELIHPIPLSIEGQVHKLIAEATSNENLVQLYVGWMPWI